MTDGGHSVDSVWLRSQNTDRQTILRELLSEQDLVYYQQLTYFYNRVYAVNRSQLSFEHFEVKMNISRAFHMLHNFYNIQMGMRNDELQS